MRASRVAAIAVATRVLQALLTQTFFQPDEYFQSLEVAHNAVFGYGHLTWEWTIERPIRSILFPSIWIPVYWILRVTGLDDGNALIWLPKLVTGLLAAITDVAVSRLSRQLFGPRAVPLTLLLTLLSLFHALSLVRSMSNSVETSLTTLALSYWPLDPQKPILARNLVLPLSIAALACAFRPTNAVIWIYLFAHLILSCGAEALSHTNKTQAKRVASYILVALTIGFVVFLNIPATLILPRISALVVQALADYLYFGELTLTPLNFLRVNLSSVSLFYGGNPWHYYLTQAVPILLANYLPFFAYGIYLTLVDKQPKATQAAMKTLLGLLCWTVLVYSFAGHKEWRFLHPILPIMHLFCVLSILRLTTKTSPRGDLLAILQTYTGFSTLVAIPAILYVIFVHGRAQIAVMNHLRSLPLHDLPSVGFLMPCHSTPWMAYLHREELINGHAWALGCEPPLRVSNASFYLDQTAAFYFSPIDYLRDHFPEDVDPTFPPALRPNSNPALQVPLNATWGSIYSDAGPVFVDEWTHTWPKHLVMFGVLPKMQGRDNTLTVGGLLVMKGYKRTWRTFNGFEEDEKRKGGVEMWTWLTI